MVSTILALRWIEENVTKYRKSKTPTAESIYAIDYSRRLELFVTSCKVFAIPMEVRQVWTHKVLSLVSSDVDVLVIHDNEGSYEEISERISTVPGRDRTGGFQETSADPSECDHDGLEKNWESVQKQHQGERVDTRGRLGKEREPESAQFLLFEPSVKGEEFAQSSEEIAGAKGMDAVL